MSFVSFQGDKMGRGVQKISVRWFERKGAVNGAVWGYPKSLTIIKESDFHRFLNFSTS